MIERTKRKKYNGIKITKNETNTEEEKSWRRAHLYLCDSDYRMVYLGVNEEWLYPNWPDGID